MSEFETFIERIRGGDEEAAVELVRRFEPLIRREVRHRLRDPHVRRLVDSMDICQSVLASFFVRAAVGDYDLEKPDHLVKLLVGMVYNKVAFQVRRHRAQRRDSRRVISADEMETVGGEATPSRVIAGRELLQEFRRRLTDDERQLADLRAQGYQWADIASRLGGSSRARCQQLARAVQRVSRQLGLDDADE